jgi:hypothetical protein
VRGWSSGEKPLMTAFLGQQHTEPKHIVVDKFSLIVYKPAPALLVFSKYLERYP